MDAIKFIETFGWGIATGEYVNAREAGTYMNGKYGVLIHQSLCEPTTENIDFVFHLNDLKTLVDAWELVDSYGGLQRSKDHLNHRLEYGLYQLPKLKQAIELVEKINAKS